VPEVSNLRAAVGDAIVTLTYGIAAEIDHVVIARSAGGAASEPVYKGSSSTFTDRGLTDNVEYRYTVTSFDGAGNGSAGVVIAVTPRRNYLRAPADGARLRKPPKLSWTRTLTASYYNVQLYRGNVKVLSAWPRRPRYSLQFAWKFNGGGQRLSAGTYRWYVWPGFGPRASVDYGPMLGARTFLIVR
jgi:hypothetical protein